MMQEATCYYEPPDLKPKTLIVFEAELARYLARGVIRQMTLTAHPEGWILQVLLVWEQHLLTLVSLRKEIRHYKDLNRLFQTIRKHGPIPPTYFIGDSP